MRISLRGFGLAAFVLVFTWVGCSGDQKPSAQPSTPSNEAEPAAPAAKEVATASPPVIAPGTGWIEGTITDTTGTPPITGVFDRGVSVVLKTGGEDVSSEIDKAAGGFFAFRNLKPGVYEAFIGAGRANGQALRPVRVSGIAVEAGKRTILKVQLKPGQELEEIGKPVFAAQNLVVISDELERLQAQIDELKKK
jgi:hypothetical protein